MKYNIDNIKLPKCKRCGNTVMIDRDDFGKERIVCPECGIWDCLSCSASFSDDADGKMILRCAEYDWKIVNENGCCKDWN